ncbi:MAG: hypothetical protein AAGJ18_03035 [Bacteroidota bacterium]
MKKAFYKLNIIWMLTLCSTWVSFAQPIESTKQKLDNITIYQDSKKENTYYYAPGDLKLVTEADGKPKFKLVQYRYTGTARTGDQGEKRYMNIVQFTVQQEQIKGADLRKVKTQLGKGTKLRPLPMRNVSAYLIAAINNKYQRLGNTGNAQSLGIAGESTRNAYWRERTFTIRLENHEAQLLWDQIAERQLSISVSYAFYADVVIGQLVDYAIVGDSLFAEGLGQAMDESNQLDSTAATQIIKANTFPIEIDLDKYPNVLQKIDGNESSIPVDFPALEVACFDFVNDARPDLSGKILSIKAIGINNQMVELEEIDFNEFQPDLNTKQVQFDRPVRINKPLRYQITEITKEGELNPLGWQSKNSWMGLLDISTPTNENPITQRTIEIETEIEAFPEKGISALIVQFIYSYKGEMRMAELEISSVAAIPLQQLTLVFDKETVPKYKVIWDYEKTGKIESRLGVRAVPLDDYLFVKFD